MAVVCIDVDRIKFLHQTTLYWNLTVNYYCASGETNHLKEKVVYATAEYF